MGFIWGCWGRESALCVVGSTEEAHDLIHSGRGVGVTWFMREVTPPTPAAFAREHVGSTMSAGEIYHPEGGID